MKDGFKLKAVGVAAISAMLFLGLMPNAQAREGRRLKREKPGLQRLAAGYYAKKYRVSLGEARRRIALQDRAAGIDDDLTKILGDQFAGIWYDHDDRGRLKVGMTREAMFKASEVGTILKRYGAAGSADLVPVRFTLAEIERKQDDARSLIMDMVASGNAQTSYSTKMNAVVVTAIAKVSEKEEVRLKDLAAREGVSVRRVDIPTLQVKFVTCTSASCNPPLRGGLAISSPVGECTSAFMARHRQNGDLLAMTAGHCIFFGGGLTDSWSAKDESNTSHAIGPAYGFSFDGSVGQDEGVIKIAPGSVWPPVASLIVMASSTTVYDPGYAIYHTSWSSMGQVLCRTGFTTGTECAEVSALGADESGIGPDGLNHVVKQMGELDMCGAQPGDSGGPIYKMGRAYGILDGVEPYKPIHCFESYQGIRGAEATLNVDVLLEP